MAGEKSKLACGGGCGCQEPKDPYQESLHAVWQDPTSYDPLKHGPSYLPKTASSNQKAAARGIAAKVLNPKVAQTLFPSLSPLAGLLSVLRAAATIHQTHHWQTNGGHYYADHLLFERLYNESQGFIDQVAERAVGLDDSKVVDAADQTRAVAVLVANLCNGGLDPDEMISVSLRTESMVVQAVTVALERLEAQGELTNGTDNLLQGVSDLHEGFVYLLQQRLKGSIYDYGR